VVTRFGTLGVTQATTVFTARAPTNRPTLLSNLLGFSLVTATVSALLVCGGMLLIPGARPPGVSQSALVLLAGGLLLSSLVEAGYSFLLGCGRFRPHALITCSASWLYAALLVLIWQSVGLSVVRALAVWNVAQAVRGLALLVACTHDVRPGRPNLRLLQESMGFGIRAWVGTVARIGSFRFDQIVMAFMASPAALGAYAVAVNASEILLYLPQATDSAIVPMIARSEPQRRAEATLRAFRSLMLVTGASVIVAVALGPPLLPVVFGSAYEASVGPFLWLLPGAFGYVALGVFSSALLASGAPGHSSLGPLVSLVLGIMLDVALIPPFGATGAAVATSAAVTVGGGLALAAYWRLERFEWGALVVPHLGDLVLLRALVGLLGTRVASRAKVS
jgi:O-antigen/teichoic acid export membrane protein